MRVPFSLAFAFVLADLPAQLAWTRLANGLAIRQYHAIAYDAARARTVLFGGRGNPTSSSDPVAMDDTWTWDGSRWSRATPAVSPTGRFYHAMAYDALRQRVVLFGGRLDTQSSASSNETWEWTGAAWLRKTPPLAPSGRYQTSLVYDQARGRCVLFGGVDSTGHVLEDTWEWDGNTWALRAKVSGPTARGSMSLAYDEGRQRVVGFGGFGGTGNATYFADTWEWDGVAWTQRVTTPSPPSQTSSVLVYDQHRKVSTLFGSNALHQVWDWNGSSWQARTTVNAPTSLFRNQGAWDSARQRAVVFGASLPSDTWEWDGTNWSCAQTSAVPYPRFDLAPAFDVARNVMVLVADVQAGNGPPGTPSYTWEWNGQLWTPRDTPICPSARRASAITYDAGRNRTVLFGGDPGSAPGNQETWEWDGATWSPKTPANLPPGRSGHVMTYDAVRARVVMFGGGTTTLFRDTWEWDGSDWQQRTSAVQPPGRIGHAMAFDSRRQRTVLFGSTTGSRETWEWDGTTWQLANPAHSPPALYRAALAYDAFRERVVLFGGSLNGTVPQAGIWEWDGSDWSQRVATGTPLPRNSAGLVFDPGNARLVLYGGSSGQSTLFDVWELTTTAPPAQSPFGYGCGGFPQLSCAGLPWIGSPLTLEVHGAPSTTWSAALLGSSRTSWAGKTLPMSLSQFGFGFCVLYTSIDAAVLAPIITNGAKFVIPVPDVAGLIGAKAYAQGMVQDPTANSAGFALTHALDLKFGAR